MVHSPAVKLDQTDIGTVNDNCPNTSLSDQARIASRLAALGYLYDDRPANGAHGRDTYYLVGDASYRVIWCRESTDPDITVEHHLDDQWRVLWRGCALGFLCDGPDTDKISPVKPRFRRLGQIMETMRRDGAATRCQWQDNTGHGSLSIAVVSQTMEPMARHLVIKPATSRVCLTVDGQAVATLSLTESFSESADDFCRNHFESFLKTQPHARSERTVGKRWKTLRENVVTFLTSR
jgi:hypothetical protein